MDVTALTLRGGYPETVTVVLDAREAALVAGVLGRAELPYDEDVAGVRNQLERTFNAFYEDGLGGALRAHGVVLPARLVPAPEVPR